MGFFFWQNIGKNISKSLSSKYRKKLLNHAKQSASDPFKTASKRAIQITTGDLTGSNTANKFTKASKSSLQNSPDTVINEEENVGVDRDIPRERYIYP